MIFVKADSSTIPAYQGFLTLPPLGFLDVDDTGGGVNVTHTL